MTIVYDSLQNSLIGPVHVALRNHAVIAVDFGIDQDVFRQDLAARVNSDIHHSRADSAAALRSLSAYLEGDLTPFDVPVELSGLSDFQREVLSITTQIPAGRTLTYGEVAGILGDMLAIRAVGGALGTNPVPIFIPCHRVMAANGKLGGFSGSGGPETKRKLLVHEGVLML